MLTVATLAAAAFVAPPLQTHRTRASSLNIAMADVEQLRFMTADQARSIASEHGTPVYVYDEAGLQRQATSALAFPHAYGLTVRFAMKALPNAAVLQTFDRLGLHIADAVVIAAAIHVLTHRALHDGWRDYGGVRRDGCVRM